MDSAKPGYLTTPEGPTNEGFLRKCIKSSMSPDNLPIVWGSTFFIGSIAFIRVAGELLVPAF
ncbi:hypothetical protein E3Q22_04096 [Wallemia mellicola]|uniref:Uncharacterized protein n=2 Tax=Wallemia mellicola TaxID=1708541 RepID=A0A4T0RJ09_9BASI|nr:hypothetical protein WALSEDRAFT_70309 [Wallemia mellicola CBS 633.66]TIB67843.1 hypothetical protein E3Q24_03987 [Wallemia mellicola]EIM19779.1 hypothetical protein WALSEDRAFT_70309 [Wallemia mellicola CBS 633.66]TIB70682.1 hypothetical protein E3Q23_04085 [Wallemia mellicola]TIB74980.1 hypothetical protein E3Q22_04096 [Wallemia mellicola]TIB79803.1 hypothetical protein E3Q21_04056 [Wallemia mellicola]|eukprot:XP_006960113.1 hypothetical protein WALSEDRAFT_70309 [Wallemia mellicola CBS 633.66]